MKQGWLNQNIGSILAIICITCGWAILFIVLLGRSKTQDNQVITGVFGIMMFVLGYYFGASKLGNDRARAEMEIKKIQEERTATITQAAKAAEDPKKDDSTTI